VPSAVTGSGDGGLPLQAAEAMSVAAEESGGVGGGRQTDGRQTHSD
jgi:hypothetical protein